LTIKKKTHPQVLDGGISWLRKISNKFYEVMWSGVRVRVIA